MLLEYDLRRGGFAAHCKWLGERACASSGKRSSVETARVANLACALYLRRVHCLQRSVMLCALLRTHGFPAEMVIGARSLPFAGHAWVEVDGNIVGDSQEFITGLTILQRIRSA